ncbi:MAG: hypothetical protein FVQ79_07085 [Planctomycetes bacterium]|nr:hypothetical protein [Planctomycetota bacterium]
MLTLLAAGVVYGGYVSIIKLAVYFVLFLLWMPLVNWVHSDSQSVRTKVQFWTYAITLAGVVSLLVWPLVPVFFIGLMLYIIAVGAVLMAYVMHRNSLVADFEKVLTASHIKGIFSNENKKLAKSSKGVHFITANGNDVPLPAPKTTESFGFATACEIFEDAIWRRTSDILFAPSASSYTINYVIDGLATRQEPKDHEDIDYFIHYLKQVADLDPNEKRKPQRGMMEVRIAEKKTKWEVNTAGSTAGEQMRIKRYEESDMMKIEDIGLDKDQLETLKGVRGITSGLFITSGPPKTGVTATFYAMLKNHDPFMNDMNTLEKHPSGTLDNITQNTYSLSDTGTSSYASHLQTIVRMGSNIIGIADVDDAETAKVATKAAAANRMVHVNIHAQSVLKAIAAWIKLCGDKNTVMSNIKGVINQRIVRKLCDECKQAYKPNPNLLRKFNLPADKITVFYRPGEIEYDKHGKPILCEKCQGTGFYGRTGIFETIVIGDELRGALKKVNTLQEMSALFRKAGMFSIQERSIRKVMKGVTSINEVIREFTSDAPKKKVRKKK